MTWHLCFIVFSVSICPPQSYHLTFDFQLSLVNADTDEVHVESSYVFSFKIFLVGVVVAYLIICIVYIFYPDCMWCIYNFLSCESNNSDEIPLIQIHESRYHCTQYSGSRYQEIQNRSTIEPTFFVEFYQSEPILVTNVEVSFVFDYSH